MSAGGGRGLHFVSSAGPSPPAGGVALAFEIARADCAVRRRAGPHAASLKVNKVRRHLQSPHLCSL